MDREKTLETLRAVQSGTLTPEAALGLFAQAPYEDLGFAKIDHHRGLRNGSGEVIYGAGKTAEQIAGIVARMIAAGSQNILITRMDADKAEAVGKVAPLFYEPLSRVGIANRAERPLVGSVVVASGGTSALVFRPARISSATRSNSFSMVVLPSNSSRSLPSGSRSSARSAKWKLFTKISPASPRIRRLSSRRSSRMERKILCVLPSG